VKELDFVRLTLWLAGIVIVAFLVGWWWKGREIRQTEKDLAQIRVHCAEIGRIVKDLKILQDERRNDKLPQELHDKTGIISYFSQMAQRCQINPSRDYTWKPRDPDVNKKGGWVDQAYMIDFKKDQGKSRDQIMKFIFNCESQSRRIKLQKARLSLPEEWAEKDLWNADSLVFVQRNAQKTAGG